MGYDAIIIGSGLGGCGAAAPLAAAGKKLLILERLGAIGGRCSTAKDRDGFRRDIGCHHLFGCEHGAFEKAARLVNRGGVIRYGHATKFGLFVHDKKIVFDGKTLAITGDGEGDIVVNLTKITRQMRGLSKIGGMMPAVYAVLEPIIK
ncbi:MAG: NAD(P)-binding protein, partial [Actinobacteria bacterium]|nr:NAD(P)-binding protein [Actinomycetota bacterium]